MFPHSADRGAARILGVALNTVRRMVASGALPATGPKWANDQLSRAEVEALALRHWRSSRTRTAGSRVYRTSSAQVADSYWTDRAGAARLLGVTPGRVRQLCDAGRIPFETTPSGVRVFRRDQLRTVDNARLSRRLR